MGIVELLFAANVLTLAAYWVGQWRGGRLGRSKPIFIALTALFTVGMVVIVVRGLSGGDEYVIRSRVERELRFQALLEAKRGLMQLADAQEGYKAKNGSYASRDELADTGVLGKGWARSLDANELARGPYVYRMVVPETAEQGGKHWWCYVEPNRSLPSLGAYLPNQNLFADSTGILLVGRSMKYPAYVDQRVTGDGARAGDYALEHWCEWERFVTAYRMGRLGW